MITSAELDLVARQWGNPGVPCAMLDGSFGLLVVFGEKLGVQVPEEANHRWRTLVDFRLCGGPVGSVHRLPNAQELIRRYASDGGDKQWLLEVPR
jgi:hypothetical protein